MTKPEPMRKASVLALTMLPFMLNLGLIEFLIPIKYDIVLENLPLLGFAVSVAFFASSLSILAIGNLTNRLGVKKTTLLGVLVAVAGAAVFAASADIFVMTLGVFLWAVSYCVVSVPMDTYLLSRFPANQRGSAMAVWNAIFCAAYAVAPFIAFFLTTTFNMDWAIAFAAGLAAFSFVLMMRFRIHEHTESVLQAVEEVIREDGVLKKEVQDIAHLGRKDVAVFFNMFVSGFWWTTFAIGLPLLFFHETGDLWNAALFMGLFVAPFAFMDYFFATFSNLRRNRHLLINAGFLIGSLLLMVFYVTNDFYMMLALVAGIAVSVTAGWCATEVDVSDHLPKGKKAEFMSVYLLAKNLGFDFAPMFYGMLAAVDLKLPFLAAGVVVFAGWLFFGVTHGFGKE